MKDKNGILTDDLASSLVIDTGLFIDFFSDGPLADFVEKQILNNEEVKTIYIHDYTIAEVYYVICRQKGEEEAQKIVAQLEKITYIVPPNELRLIAGKIKCERTISLSDCFTCSIAIKFQIPVLFKSERELRKEKLKKEFDFKIHLID